MACSQCAEVERLQAQRATLSILSLFFSHQNFLSTFKVNLPRKFIYSIRRVHWVPSVISEPWPKIPPLIIQPATAMGRLKKTYQLITLIASCKLYVMWRRLSGAAFLRNSVNMSVRSDPTAVQLWVESNV